MIPNSEEIKPVVLIIVKSRLAESISYSQLDSKRKIYQIFKLHINLLEKLRVTLKAYLVSVMSN